ncbi:hypothetical protein ACTXM3_18225 [Glutamicibacter arilaitensis]|uniref:Secreted protein n=1 Tax=Glutamicibacter arilaitensis TaxID=256701 RepID=A0A2N7RY40_9MICC|nr:hypothetical protein [Glutamicibacter arilaitensis]PMQ18804.1 hypothetical protein CIK84_15525 [Glutamicibacter arilaitensis]
MHAKGQYIRRALGTVLAIPMVLGLALQPATAAPQEHVAVSAPVSATSSKAGSVKVCDGNTVRPTDAAGNPLPKRVLKLMLKQVSQICDETSSEGVDDKDIFAQSDSDVELFGDFGYAYLAAYATYRADTLSVYFTAAASSIPSGYHSLSCIYRQEPTSGGYGAWQSCGASSGSGTYLTTSTASFCPIPGTRWHAHAALYKGYDDVLKQTDDDWVIAG